MTRTLYLPTRDFLDTEEETEDKRVFDRELASDKKFFELDAKSKSESSDSEGTKLMGMNRRLFHIVNFIIVE